MDKFKEIQKDLPSQDFVKDIRTFIVFGSNVVNNNTGQIPDDIDICVVVKNRTADMDKITQYIFSKFPKPDFRIYVEDELESNLNFVDVGNGLFAMEYFANGLSLYGENIFIEKLQNVDREKLAQSYLNKIFEYILRIRTAYLSPNLTPEHKKWHLNKYVLRLSIDILLYRKHVSYADLKELNKDQIFDLCRKHGIIKEDREIEYGNTESMYDVFTEINRNVVEFHTENKEATKELGMPRMR